MTPHPAIAAVIVVLAASADYQLTTRWPGGEWTACAKSAATCEDARAAISRGLWLGTPTDAVGTCAPRPGCFDERSNCIQGFNCQ